MNPPSAEKGVRWLLVIIWLLVLGYWSFPAVAATLTEELLKTGIGIRPLGMGGAFTAVADDINSIFYNPAGLANLPIFGYSAGDQDLNREESNQGYNLLNLGPICYASWLKKDLTGNTADLSAYGFGRKGTRGMLWGLTYKNVRWNTGFGWSSDVGLLINILPEVSVGILAQDVAQDRNLDTPIGTRLGLALKPFKEKLILAADVELRGPEKQVFGHCGLETTITEGFKVRLGSDNGNFTAGLGFDFPVFTLNYAAVPYPEQTIHRFGVEMSLGGREERPFSIIKPKELALIEVGGRLTGGESEFSFFGGSRTGADGILRNIKRATKDPGIDGILLRIKGFEGGLGSPGIVQELRAELKRAKKEGKKVVAYVEASSLGDEYYLTSIADKIVAPPQASVGGIGKTIGIPKVRELFDKIGIEWQILATGKYKAAFDSLSPEMTKEQKEMVSSLVEDLYRQMINDISTDRNISLPALKEIGDGRILIVEEAKAQGLIDEIGYFKDATRLGAKLAGAEEEGEVVPPDKLRPQLEEEFFAPLPKIAVIEVNGEIVTGKSGSNIIFGGMYTGSDTVAEGIKKAKDDWTVRAIILRVNSGGGSSVASAQIYQEIKKAREKVKVVVASLGDMAASGGYYVASGADKIVADPGTLTGAIGVVGAIPVFSELYKKIGVKYEMFKEGKHADMFSGLRKLTLEERKSLEDLMEKTYQEFIKAVAEGRKLPTEEVEAVAQGRVYTGSQALENKLVDKLGNFSDAVDEAKTLAKIRTEPQLIYYRPEGLAVSLF